MLTKMNTPCKCLFLFFFKLSLVSRILQSRIAPKTELHSNILYQNDTKGGEIREKKTKLVAQHSFVACFGRYFPLLSEKDFFRRNIHHVCLPLATHARALWRGHLNLYYSGTPPYGHPVNTVTSLLRPLFFGAAKRPYIRL